MNIQGQLPVCSPRVAHKLKHFTYAQSALSNRQTSGITQPRTAGVTGEYMLHTQHTHSHALIEMLPASLLNSFFDKEDCRLVWF